MRRDRERERERYPSATLTHTSANRATCKKMLVQVSLEPVVVEKKGG